MVQSGPKPDQERVGGMTKTHNLQTGQDLFGRTTGPELRTIGPSQPIPDQNPPLFRGGIGPEGHNADGPEDPTISPSTPDLVTLKGGLVVEASVLRRLLDLEDRGATFTLTDAGFLIQPPEVLTDDDVDFIRLRRLMAEGIIAYQAPDRSIA